MNIFAAFWLGFPHTMTGMDEALLELLDSESKRSALAIVAAIVTTPPSIRSSPRAAVAFSRILSVFNSLIMMRSALRLCTGARFECRR